MIIGQFIIIIGWLLYFFGKDTSDKFASTLMKGFGLALVTMAVINLLVLK